MFSEIFFLSKEFHPTLQSAQNNYGFSIIVKTVSFETQRIVKLSPNPRIILSV